MGIEKLNYRIKKKYQKYLRPLIRNELIQQRLKMAYFTWGYWRVLFLSRLSIVQKIHIVLRFVKIDYFVLHGHKPCEIGWICQALAGRQVRRDEVMVEAGCWKGGSSAKFSILCKQFGLKLHIYDSFQGVERITSEEENGYDYSGEYSASKTEVKRNIRRFGEPECCFFHEGWFSNTFRTPLSVPVFAVYIDCDLAKGTREVITGIIHDIASDGYVFSQDFHIPPVRKLLSNRHFWKKIGKDKIKLKYLSGNLAVITFDAS